jgi:hypothetical protein
MTTSAAISPVTRNVLSVAKIPPMAVNASQMARITPRIVHINRPMYPVCAPAPCAGRRCMLTGPCTGGPGRQTNAAALSPQRRRVLKAPV